MPRRNFDASMIARLREDQSLANYLRRQQLVTSTPVSSGTNNILLNPQTTNYNSSSQTQALNGMEQTYINGSLRNVYTVGCACETVPEPPAPPAPMGIAEWATSQTSQSTALVYDTKTDPFGNIYMTIGYQTNFSVNNFVTDATNPITVSPYGTFTDPALGVCLVKYDSNGQVVWATNISSVNSNNLSPIGFDSAGNAYILAALSNPIVTINSFVSGGGGGPITTIPFGNISFSSGANVYTVLIKYNPTGQVQWVTKITSNYLLTTPSLSVTPTGSVYIVGTDTTTPFLDFYNQNGVLANNIQTTLYGRINCTALSTSFLAKYNSSGAVEWVTKIEAQSGAVKQVRAAPDGNVYICGACISDPLAFYDYTSVAFLTINTSVSGILTIGSIYAFVAKYTSSGTFQWAAPVLTGGITVTNIMGLAVDSLSNVYITGRYYGLLQIKNFSSIGGGFSILTTPYGTLPAPIAFSDVYIIKYNPTGSALWATRIANTRNVNPGALTVDSNNNLYVCGTYDRVITIDNFIASSTTSPFGTMGIVPGNNTYFIVKYSPQGSAIWATNGTARGVTDAFPSFVSCFGNNALYFSTSYRAGNLINNYNTVTAGAVTTTLYNSLGSPTFTLNSMVVKYTSL